MSNQNLIGQREYLILSMQMSENMLNTWELRSDLTDVQQRMANVIDNLGKMCKNTYLNFCKEYPNISVKLYKSGGIFHDRYIILDYDTADEKIFLCGGSSKDAGGKVTAILEDKDRNKYQSLIKEMLKNEELKL